MKKCIRIIAQLTMKRQVTHFSSLTKAQREAVTLIHPLWEIDLKDAKLNRGYTTLHCGKLG